MKEALPPGSIVYVVDDDVSVRNSLSNLFRSVDLSVQVFSSSASFLQHELPDAASCIVLDIRLPGSSGLDFQAELRSVGIKIPIIFLTGHGDIKMSVQAMKAGAIDFLGQREGLNLPPALSGQNNYWLWGMHGCDVNMVIAVIGDTPAEVGQKYESVDVVGVLDDPYAMPFEHKNIYLLRGRRPTAQFDWADERFYF